MSQGEVHRVAVYITNNLLSWLLPFIILFIIIKYDAQMICTLCCIKISVVQLNLYIQDNCKIAYKTRQLLVKYLCF